MNVFDDDFFFDSTPDEDPDSLWSTMKEAEEEDDKRRFYGISDQPTPQPPPEEPSPVAKSPRKRANYFSDLVDDLSKASSSSLQGRTVRCFSMKMMAACIDLFPT